MTLVESIPENLTHPTGSPIHPSTFSAWRQLIATAQTSIDIGSFYWNLRGKDGDEDPSDWQVNYVTLTYVSVTKVSQ